MRAYLPAYRLERARSLEGALARLASGEGWQPLAGGTDLMVSLAAGELPPGRFLDVWGLDALRGIQVTDDAVVLGALTTYSEVQRHPLLVAEFPMLVQAARESGAWAIQNRGTLGGNIVNASPAADSPPALLVYGARVELRSQAGTRWLPLGEFHTGYKTTRRDPSELLTALALPRSPWHADARHRYRKVATRRAQAITKVGLAALGVLRDGVLAHVRLAFSSVGPTVLAATRTQACLTGRTLDREAIDDAIAVLATEINPIDDVRSTADYRRKVACNLVAAWLGELAEEVQA